MGQRGFRQQSGGGKNAVKGPERQNKGLLHRNYHWGIDKDQTGDNRTWKNHGDMREVA